MKYSDDFINKIYQGDTLEVLKQMSSDFVNCIVTSPPYWALRSYLPENHPDKSKELGLELTFQEYINRLCNIFDEAKRVLKNDGTCFVNMGDTYGNPNQAGNKVFGNPEFNKNRPSREKTKTPEKNIKGFDKCLCQIPSRFAIEMTNRGWILRNEIIWHKPNCMPSSAKDRFTVDFEKVFFFVKNKKYWFKQQLEQHKSKPDFSREIKTKGKNFGKKELSGQVRENHDIHTCYGLQGRNKRCVWKVTTKPFSEAHFATFPEKLIIPMIKVGCSEGELVLDPFMGSGTVAVTSRKLGRNYIGIELNPEYIKIAKKRLAKAYKECKIIKKHNWW